MKKRSFVRAALLVQLGMSVLASATPALAQQSDAAASCAGPAAWVDDLTPIADSDWNRERAAHLIERAGFGATPGEIDRLARRGARGAVDHLANFRSIANNQLPSFDHSGVHDPGLEPFPPSRPATTDLAKAKGEALGVKVKPAGNRRLQPIANKFFYWLRASRLETERLAYWWANRMLTTNRPLEEKLALFWHGHFATSEDKVRDYRKMLQQLQLFQQHGSGNFRELMIRVAQDPAMLAFLDAGVNVKGAPNENFAREIMELFTMGVGNYAETDIREAARAFTGWNFRDTAFVVNVQQHDSGEKLFLEQRGNFDGVAIIDIILKQPVTAEFLAAKLYRYFVRDDLSPRLRTELGNSLRAANYEIAPLLEKIFLSRDFYSARSCGAHIKAPVELVVSAYRKLGLREIPGVPDFNEVVGALGQRLFWPPTVAGWAQGKSWITPGLLLERGNFARDVVFPDINFLPHDRYPTDPKIREVSDKIARGADVTSATMEEGKDMMATSNMMADRDEDFNTRYASYRGWQMAIEKVKPIPRHAANLDLTTLVMSAGATTTAQAVDHLMTRMLRVMPEAAMREQLIAFLTREVSTQDLASAASYLEEPLRMVLHLIMSLPEFQLS